MPLCLSRPPVADLARSIVTRPYSAAYPRILSEDERCPHISYPGFFGVVATTPKKPCYCDGPPVGRSEPIAGYAGEDSSSDSSRTFPPGSRKSPVGDGIGLVGAFPKRVTSLLLSGTVVARSSPTLARMAVTAAGIGPRS